MNIQTSQINKKVLVVEDEPVSQTIISELLKENGCDFDLAEDGASALKLAKSHQYNLILMDLGLPDMDGTSVVIQMRTQGKDLQSVPIIALTANTVHSMGAACSKAGMNDFISKPISLEKLQKILATYIPQEQPISNPCTLR